ncbi:Toxin RelE-like domain,Toxin-antitoxin system, RelE/ParE toxin family, partial [Cinara cedri]
FLVNCMAQSQKKLNINVSFEGEFAQYLTELIFLVNCMAQSQKKLNINISFENELAQYLTDMAEMENKTIQEVLVSFVKEEFEEDIELSKIADERDAEGTEIVDYKDNVTENDIPSLPVTIEARVKRAIDERLTVDPVNLGKALRGRLGGSRRLRVGSYRIIYKIDKLEHTVTITEVGHRDSIYKR